MFYVLWSNILSVFENTTCDLIFFLERRAGTESCMLSKFLPFEIYPQFLFLIFEMLFCSVLASRLASFFPVAELYLSCLFGYRSGEWGGNEEKANLCGSHCSLKEPMQRGKKSFLYLWVYSHTKLLFIPKKTFQSLLSPSTFGLVNH